MHIPFVERISKGENLKRHHTYAVNGSKGLLYIRVDLFYCRKILTKGSDFMNLMELRLQKILEENHADFVDSLRLNGIDVAYGSWNADSVNQNAQAGALSLIQFASQEGISDSCRNIFLQTIAENLNEEKRASVMAWIYAGYEWAGHFPSYAIIQHMIDPALFHEYCVSLQKYLHMYLQGYFSCPVNIV